MNNWLYWQKEPVHGDQRKSISQWHRYWIQTEAEADGYKAKVAEKSSFPRKNGTKTTISMIEPGKLRNFAKKKVHSYSSSTNVVVLDFTFRTESFSQRSGIESTINRHNTTHHPKTRASQNLAEEGPFIPFKHHFCRRGDCESWD